MKTCILMAICSVFITTLAFPLGFMGYRWSGIVAVLGIYCAILLLFIGFFVNLFEGG